MRWVDLQEQYPDDAAVQQWFTELFELCERALSYASPEPALPVAKREAARRKQQHAYEQELMQLCALYVRTSAPMHTLYERVERFLPELFVFVARTEVPSHNNLAERSVGPWSSHVRFVEVRAAPTAPRGGWRSSAALGPGPLRVSIRSSNVWSGFPRNIP